MSITSKLQSLLSAANTTTGESDADLTAAVQHLKDGYGQGGSGTGAPNDITFYDFDGTLVHSYSLSDLPLAALPEAPSHSDDGVPLTFQQWTHTLTQVNACIDRLDVGATYIPTDEKTHFIINIATEVRMGLPLLFSQTVANGVSIDWGDGSVSETFAGTGAKRTSHTYSDIGQYDIAFTVADGCQLGFGTNIFGSSSESTDAYGNVLQKIYFGARVKSLGDYAFSYCYTLDTVVISQGLIGIATYAFQKCVGLTGIVIPQGVTSIGNYAFTSCFSLATVVIPQGITSIGNYVFAFCSNLTGFVIPQGLARIGTGMFQSCSSLATVVIPQGITSIGTFAFSACYSLASVAIPQGVTSIDTHAFSNCCSLVETVIPQGITSIGDYAFTSCYSLATVVIPQGITSMGSSTFSNCSGMAVYDFSACTSIPTLSSSNVFSNIPSDCIMKIPSALFTDWSTATNWSTYAGRMVAV